MEANLAPPQEVRKIATVSEFQQVLGEASSKLLVVNFSAVWSGPCHRVSSKFNQLAQDHPHAMFVKVRLQNCARSINSLSQVDVDENIEIAASHGINCMPTFVFYRNGEKIEEFVGANEVVLNERMMPLLNNSTM